MVGRRVVGLKAVKGVPVGGKAEGVGAGVGEGEGEGAGAAPDGAASLLTRTSSPPGKAWRSSVLQCQTVDVVIYSNFPQHMFPVYTYKLETSKKIWELQLSVQVKVQLLEIYK